jgi:cysteine desulfurase
MAPALAGGPVYLDYNATTPIDPRVADRAPACHDGRLGQPVERARVRRGPAPGCSLRHEGRWPA